MVQTLTVFSSGIAEINTGTNFLLCNGLPLTETLQNKLDTIVSIISAAGISQIHVERDAFREFEHVIIAGVVSANIFGTNVSSADFDWIMHHVDAEILAQEAAAAAAAAAEAAAAAAAAEAKKTDEAAGAEGASA